MIFFSKPHSPESITINVTKTILNARSSRLVHPYVQYNLSHFSPRPSANELFSITPSFVVIEK